MLKDVVTRGSGTARAATLGRNDLAGKTGTTNEGRDTWFVGFNANSSARRGSASTNSARSAATSRAAERRCRCGSTSCAKRWPARPSDCRHGRRASSNTASIPTTGLIAGDGTPNSIFEKFDIDHLPDREENTGFVAPLDALDPGAGARPAGEPIF